MDSERLLAWCCGKWNHLSIINEVGHFVTMAVQKIRSPHSQRLDNHHTQFLSCILVPTKYPLKNCFVVSRGQARPLRWVEGDMILRGGEEVPSGHTSATYRRAIGKGCCSMHLKRTQRLSCKIFRIHHFIETNIFSISLCNMRYYLQGLRQTKLLQGPIPNEKLHVSLVLKEHNKILQNIYLSYVLASGFPDLLSHQPSLP